MLFHKILVHLHKNSTISRRFGAVVGILAYYARGREFDSRIVLTFVCINMSVCIGSGSKYNMYVFTKKYIISKYVFILQVSMYNKYIINKYVSMYLSVI
jgi:hypothetical protein